MASTTFGVINIAPINDQLNTPWHFVARHACLRFDGRVKAPKLHRVVRDGGIDLVLAGILAVVAVVIGWVVGDPFSIGIDLLAALLVVCAVRWPYPATAMLAALMSIYIWSPSSWLDLGHFAALIVVLGAGLRQRTGQRLFMAVASITIFTVDQLVDFPPGDTRAVSASFAWLMFVAGAWLSGNALTTLRLAQERAALTDQRLALAREMHDGVARTLTRLSRRAHEAAADSGDSRFADLANDASQAITQLRLSLVALRDPRTPATDAESLPEALTLVAHQLQVDGHPVTMNIHGDLDALPAAHQKVLVDVLSEAVANAQHHGAPDSLCTIDVHAHSQLTDLVVTNQIEPRRMKGGEAVKLGLIGAAERLEKVGGRLLAQQEGTRWITRATIPASGS